VFLRQNNADHLQFIVSKLKFIVLVISYFIST